MLRKSLSLAVLQRLFCIIYRIVGAALRPDDYSILSMQLANYSRTCAKQAVLDMVFNVYNALLLAFAIGAYSALKNMRVSSSFNGILIGIQVLSFSWDFFQ